MSDAERKPRESPGGASERSDVGDGDGESLETFKHALDDADIHDVNEHHHRARWNWNPVTDTGGAGSARSGGRSAFQFDLGGALARLGGDGDEHPEDHRTPGPAAPSDGQDADDQPEEVAAHGAAGAPTATVASDVPASPEVTAAPDIDLEPLPPLERRERRRSVADDPLPPLERRERAAPVAHQAPEPADAGAPASDPAPTSRHSMISRRSVFEDAATSTPTLPGPGSVPTMPMSNVQQPGATASPAPTLPAGGPSAPSLPTLPKSNPVAPPPVVTPVDSAPSTPDVHALRSAQLRTARNQRQSKLFSRTFLALIVVGVLIGAAMLFGRNVLFPTDWQAELTPLVDELQEATGTEFDHTVPLVVQPQGEYAATVTAATVGLDWIDSVPQWRALGLAGPGVTIDSVGAAIADRIPAFYDPASDTIYQTAAAADPTDALRYALTEAFLRQTTEAAGADSVEPDPDASSAGLTGVSSLDELTRRAIDAMVIRRNVVDGDAVVEPVEAIDGDDAADPSAPAAVALPLPVAYELGAIDVLGEAILLGGNVDPASVGFGVYPTEAFGVLDDDPVGTAGGLLRPGEAALADPVALGADDWSLVWGTHLSDATVERLVSAVTADSYRPFSRNGRACFVGVFQTTNEADGSFVLASVSRWASMMPAGSEALATAFTPTRVQLEACDPADAALAPDPAGVDSLLNRQIDRLAS